MIVQIRAWVFFDLYETVYLEYMEVLEETNQSTVISKGYLRKDQNFLKRSFGRYKDNKISAGPSASDT